MQRKEDFTVTQIFTVAQFAGSIDQKKETSEFFSESDYAFRFKNPEDAERYRTSLAASHLARADSYLSLGMGGEAILGYTTAIKVDPKCAMAYRKRGNILLFQRKTDEAICDYREAIKLEPENPAPYIQSGLAYMRQGKPHEALVTYLQFLLKTDNQQNLQIANRFINKSKSDIFEAIKTFPQNEKIALLKQCLSQTTILGERFWKPEGNYPCSLGRGKLKEITDELQRLTGPKVSLWQPSTRVLDERDKETLVTDFSLSRGMHNLL